MRILVSGATATMREIASSPESGMYADWLGVLVTPQTGNRLCALPYPWAADNAAFSAPDDDKFWKLCIDSWGMDRHCPPLWVAVPDVVADHQATRRLFDDWTSHWRYEIGTIPFPLSFVLQDGCTADEVPWDEIDAVFVGGSTKFKLRESEPLIREAKLQQKLVHIGRVNTMQRLRFAFDVGADTVDGTSFSMFPKTYIPPAVQYLRRLSKSPTLF